MADTKERYSCQECTRDDLSLTKNGRVRSHTADGRRASDDNPVCGGGSAYPIQDTEHHAHVFAYGDDIRSGSFCTAEDCGMAEPDNLGNQRQEPVSSDVATTGDTSWVDDSDPQAAMAEALDPQAVSDADDPVPPLPAEQPDKPTASEYREASAVVRGPSGPRTQWAQDILDRAVKYGVRADDPEGECTCPGKKKGDQDVHNAACVKYVPRIVTATGGPNRHRAPLPTGGASAPGARRTPSAAASGSAPKTSPVPQQSAEDFLGGDSARQAPSAAASGDPAVDFLAEEEPEAEESYSPTYFPARYDGTCGSCGERFLEGDQITRDPDGSGDWIAENCCGARLAGDDADQIDRYDPMTRLKAKIPIKNGRYRALHPVTGKADHAFTRVTTFVKLASDSFALSQWSQRMTALGLVHQPDLGRKVRDLLERYGDVPVYELAKAERDRLNELVEQAKEAAGHKVRAAKGTILHTHTEKSDRGEQQLGEVPSEFRPDVAAYLDAIDRFGLRSHTHLVERSTVVAEMNVVGTLDRNYEITREITATLPGKGKTPGRTVTLKPGEFVVGDVKSGADLQYGQMEIATQIALYAKGQNKHGIATPVLREDGKGYRWEWRKPGESAMDGTDWTVPTVREDVGVVVHIPYGEHTATVYLVDLEEGWKNAQVCLSVQERQSRKKVFTALPLSAVKGAQGPRTDMPTAAQLAEGHPSVTGRVNGRIAEESAAEAQSPERTAKASADSLKPGEIVTTWAQRFAAAQSRQELKDVAVAATEAGMPSDVLEAFLWDGVKRFPEKAQQKDAPSWWERFAAIPVGDRDALNALAKEAQAAGMPKDRILDLYQGRMPKTAPAAPAPSWADRFKSAPTMEALKEVCRAAQAAGMPKDRILEHFTRNKERIEIPF